MNIMILPNIMICLPHLVFLDQVIILCYNGIDQYIFRTQILYISPVFCIDHCLFKIMH